MIIAFLRELFHRNTEEQVMDAEYTPCRDALSLAGLDEEQLRQMDPDDRVLRWSRQNWIPMTISIWPAESNFSVYISKPKS